MVQIRVSPKNFFKNTFGSGGIRTHASEETGALNQRLRPLGHATSLKKLKFVFPKSEMNMLSVFFHFSLQTFFDFQQFNSVIDSWTCYLVESIQMLVTNWCMVFLNQATEIKSIVM